MEKTQVLTISSAIIDCESFLTTGDTTITSNQELKMLGFYFSTKPSIQLQADRLIRKASKHTFLLSKYKNYGVPIDKLKIIYTSTIRSVLEYSSNTYHSQINRGQANQLERAKKKCIKIIYGYQKSYQELLTLSKLDSMEDRRVKLFDKFTKKTLENPKYQHWFPLKTCIRDTRVIRPYIEERATSVRLYRSPIYAMRRLLNDKIPVETDPKDLTGLYNAP